MINFSKLQFIQNHQNIKFLLRLLKQSEVVISRHFLENQKKKFEEKGLFDKAKENFS